MRMHLNTSCAPPPRLKCLLRPWFSCCEFLTLQKNFHNLSQNILRPTPNSLIFCSFLWKHICSLRKGNNIYAPPPTRQCCFQMIIFTPKSPPITPTTLLCQGKGQKIDAVSEFLWRIAEVFTYKMNTLVKIYWRHFQFELQTWSTSPVHTEMNPPSWNQRHHHSSAIISGLCYVIQYDQKSLGQVIVYDNNSLCHTVLTAQSWWQKMFYISDIGTNWSKGGCDGSEFWWLRDEFPAIVKWGVPSMARTSGRVSFVCFVQQLWRYFYIWDIIAKFVSDLLQRPIVLVLSRDLWQLTWPLGTLTHCSSFCLVLHVSCWWRFRHKGSFVSWY